jgi:hypothetical protein
VPNVSREVWAPTLSESPLLPVNDGSFTPDAERAILGVLCASIL